tara:strand:- start:5685 stop:5948 length:264 start_codon:yes stop_codon:yes gene_type:complete
VRSSEGGWRDKHRDHSLRLDTSIGAENVYGSEGRLLAPGLSAEANDITFNTADATFAADTVLSSRSELRNTGECYIYGGYGPGNDSQ